MRMLRLRAYYNPEQTAAAHLDDDLSEALAMNDIFCVNYTPTPTRGISYEEYKKYKKGKNKEEYKYDNHMIIYRFLMFRERKNPIQRAIRYLLCSLKEYRLGTKEKNISIVFSSSTPPTQGLLSALVAKKLSKKYGHKVPFVFCLQDIFPDSLVNTKMTYKGSLIWKIGRKIEDYTYRCADKIITISDGFKSNIMAKGVPEGKIVVIPNWVNTDVVYPVERKDNILFDRYRLDRSLFYVSYCGNIGHSQNMDMLLDSAKMVNNPRIRFVIFGEGALKEYVKNRIENENIDNIIMIPYQDYSEIAHVFSLGDVGIIVSKPGVGISSIPSKALSIMAAARPVLASFDKNSELSYMIEKAQCGIVVSPDSKYDFVNAINTLYQNKYSVKGENGRNYVTTFRNKNVCTGKYVEVISECLRPLS